MSGDSGSPGPGGYWAAWRAWHYRLQQTQSTEDAEAFVRMVNPSGHEVVGGVVSGMDGVGLVRAMPPCAFGPAPA